MSSSNSSPIFVWSYLKEYETEKAEILSAVDKVFSSGQLILGEEVRSFENEFSHYCQAKFGIGVNNATDALFLSLKALGIGPGDEVITVANTAVPTVSAIVATGATPKFVDINEETYLIDVTKIDSAISAKTKCIIPVHLYGQSVDMDHVMALAKKRGLFVVEDCAQAHGAEYKGKMVGSFGDLAAFSFYPTKILGAYGDAGMVVTSSSELAERLKRLRFYGMEKTYYSIELGYNSRLDEVHAAILRGKLKKIQKYLKARQEIALNYDQNINQEKFILPKKIANGNHAYYLYVVRHPERERLMSVLKEQGIHLNISYPWPIHTMPAFKHLGYKQGDLPCTEKMANEIFSLPMYPTLDKNDQRRVIEALNQFV